jgi:hypothetical protein
MKIEDRALRMEDGEARLGLAGTLALPDANKSAAQRSLEFGY